MKYFKGENVYPKIPLFGPFQRTVAVFSLGYFHIEMNQVLHLLYGLSRFCRCIRSWVGSYLSTSSLYIIQHIKLNAFHYYGRTWRYRDYAKYIHPNCGDLKKPPTRGGYEGAFAKSVWLWATIHGLTKTQPDMETPTRVTFSCNACRWGILREPCNYCNWREGHPTTTSERPSTTVSLVQGTTPVNHL